MRAAGVRTYGGPFEPFDAAVPQVGDDQVLVRVAAAGIGLWDTAAAAGAFGTDRPLPLVLGWEGSGVVERVGAAVTGLAVGDRVIGYDRSAAWYAQYVAMPAATTVRAPAGIDLGSAAALPIGGSTALQGLVDALRLRADETVLVTAASGATGVLAVGLAKELGATVLATTGPANLDAVRALGADEVYDHTRGTAGVLADVLERHPKGVDALFDCVSGENFAALSDAVRPGGRAAGITPPLPDVRADVDAYAIVSAGDATTLDEVVRLAETGVFEVAVQAVFDLERVADAHALLATRHGFGKILLAPPSRPA